MASALSQTTTVIWRRLDEKCPSGAGILDKMDTWTLRLARVHVGAQEDVDELHADVVVFRDRLGGITVAKYCEANLKMKISKCSCYPREWNDVG